MIPSGEPAVLILRYDWRNRAALFVHNFDSKPHEVRFSIGDAGEHGNLLINLLTEDHDAADRSGKHGLVIEGYGYRWYRVGGLDYLLRQMDIEDPILTKK